MQSAGELGVRSAVRSASTTPHDGFAAVGPWRRLVKRRRRGLATAIPPLIWLLAACDAPEEAVLDQHLFLDPNVPVIVTITEVENISVGDGLDDPDFFSVITINGASQESAVIDGEDHIFPNWTFAQNVPADQGFTNVRIEIWDDDDFLKLNDDHADTSPAGDDIDLDLRVDLASGRWTGDGIAFPQRCASGGGDGDGAVKVCFTITIPTTDLDGDGLLDRWEVNGLGSINLPAMGANPMHKDLFLELDWMTGQQVTRQSIQAMRAAFAAGPVNAGGVANPDGQPGITLHVDTGSWTDPAAPEGAGTCGDGLDNDGNGLTDVGDPACLVGDNLGGGNAIAPTNLPNQVGDPQFYVLKAANFDPNRALIFRYAIAAVLPVVPDGMGGTQPLASGGQAEIGGNDLVEFNHDGGTIMHELGHTLNLRHGGNVDANCKPNYVSVMSYDQQFGIPQNGGGSILDYSPPRFAGGRGTVPGPLTENALNEAVVLDATDAANQFIFSNPAVSPNAKLRRTMNAAANWDNDAAGNLNPMLITVNIDTSALVGTPPRARPAACTNSATDSALNGFDDWSNISLSFRHFGDAADGAVNPYLEPELPLTDLIAMQRGINTADLSLTLTDTPDPVAAGETLTYTIEIGNHGPNPTARYRVELDLPAGIAPGALPAGCALSGSTVGCARGYLATQQSQQLVLPVRVNPALVFNNGGPLSISATARVINQAGDDPGGGNNAATTTTQVFAKADVSLTGHAALSAPPSDLVIGAPLLITVRDTFTNSGPSGPINTILDQSASASAGASITPTSTSSPEPALGLQETRFRDTVYTVRCLQPGAHTFVINAAIALANAADVDPNLANNGRSFSFMVECVVPVAVNIEPGAFPNSISLSAQGNIPLAVLTTRAGEYGLPLAFTATAIDPLSTRFGPRALVFSELGGAPESHGLGHPADSYEKNERTRDGDVDMVLHFDTQRTGLMAGATEGCIKGQFTSGGQRFKFFGCDSVVIVP